MTSVIIITLVILYFVLPMRGRFWPIGAIAGPVAILVMAPLAVRHARRILNSDHPLAAIATAIAVLLTVLVLGFATTYYTISIHAPSEITGLTTKVDALYYTVTILTTVGFGDIQAAGQFARGVVTVHMLANFIVLAVSVRLVLWAGRQRVQGVGEGRMKASPLDVDP